jgi:acyl dehydratase
VRLGAREFTLADQLAFAQLSGDKNPIHVDPVAARRLLNGHLVVHGLHLAAWGIESIFAEHPGGLEQVRVSFHRPLPTDQGVTATAARVGQGWQLLLTGDGQTFSRAHVALGMAPSEPAGGLPGTGVRAGHRGSRRAEAVFGPRPR